MKKIFAAFLLLSIIILSGCGKKEESVMSPLTSIAGGRSSDQDKTNVLEMPKTGSED